MAVAKIRRQPRIPLEELCRLPSFYLPLLSWKRDRVAFYWDETGRIELHVMDLQTRAVRQVSHGEVPRALRTGYTWDRSDRCIVFGRDTAGNEQHDLFKIDVETSAVTPLTEGGVAEQHAVEFSPDNRWLLVNTNKSHPDAPDRPGQLNLWLMRPDGSGYRPITRHAFPAFGGSWSPDGQWISFVTNEDATDLKNRDGYVVRPDGSEARRVFHLKPGSQDTVGHWHPDSRRLAVTSDSSGVDRAGILDVATGAVRWLSPEGIEEHALRFSEEGRYLACFRNHESRSRSAERAAEAQLAARPALDVIEPSAGVPPYPLLVALHGNGSSAALEAWHRESAASAGWLVALPTSSQLMSAGRAGWFDRESGSCGVTGTSLESPREIHGRRGTDRARRLLSRWRPRRLVRAPPRDPSARVHRRRALHP